MQQLKLRVIGSMKRKSFISQQQTPKKSLKSSRNEEFRIGKKEFAGI
jgi:hypothetical protein